MNRHVFFAIALFLLLLSTICTKTSNASVDWSAVNKSMKRMCQNWLDGRPGPCLILMRLAMNSSVRLMQRFLKIAGLSWERRQQLLASRGQPRCYRVTEAYAGKDVEFAFSALEEQFHEPIKALGLSARNNAFQVLAFRLLARMAGALHLLLRLPRAGFPYRLFSLLQASDPEQAAEDMLKLPDCLFDPGSKKFISENGSKHKLSDTLTLLQLEALAVMAEWMLSRLRPAMLLPEGFSCPGVKHGPLLSQTSQPNISAVSIERRPRMTTWASASAANLASNQVLNAAGRIRKSHRLARSLEESNMVKESDEVVEHSVHSFMTDYNRQDQMNGKTGHRCLAKSMMIFERFRREISNGTKNWARLPQYHTGMEAEVLCLEGAPATEGCPQLSPCLHHPLRWSHFLIMSMKQVARSPWHRGVLQMLNALSWQRSVRRLWNSVSTKRTITWTPMASQIRPWTKLLELLWNQGRSWWASGVQSLCQCARPFCAMNFLFLCSCVAHIGLYIPQVALGLGEV